MKWYAIAAMMITACGTADAPRPVAAPLATAAIDTSAGGVVHVRNSGATAWRDTTGWHFTVDHIIAPTEESPGMLGITDGLAMDDDGAVYAMQRKPARILVFNAAGTYTHTIGREGDGPGDLHSGMVAVTGDTVAVQQPNNSRLSFFRRDGSALTTHRTACCYQTPQLIVDSLHRIWIPGSMLARGLPGWVLTGLDGKRQDTVIAPTDAAIPWPPKSWTAPMMYKGREATAYSAIPLSARVLSTPRADGTVIFGRNNYAGLVISKDGTDTLRTIEFPAQPIPLTAVQRDSIMVAAIDRMKMPDGTRASRLNGKVEDLPANWPIITGLSTDRESRIWVGLAGERGELSRLLVFSPEGLLLGDVPPPHPKFFDGVWGKDGKLVIVTESAEGMPTLTVFRLETSAKT